MAVRSTTSEYQPAPPKVRLGARGTFASTGNTRVIAAGASPAVARGANMGMAPATSSNRPKGVTAKL